MNVTYYVEDGKYHAITDESPKGFRNVLYVGRGPDASGKIVEQLYEVTRVRRMHRLAEVPVDVIRSLGYEQPPEEPVFDLAGEELLDLAPVPKRQPPVLKPQPKQSKWAVSPYDQGMLIGLAIFLIILWYYSR